MGSELSPSRRSSSFIRPHPRDDFQRKNESVLENLKSLFHDKRHDSLPPLLPPPSLTSTSLKSNLKVTACQPAIPSGVRSNFLSFAHFKGARDLRASPSGSLPLQLLSSSGSLCTSSSSCSLPRPRSWRRAARGWQLGSAFRGARLATLKDFSLIFLHFFFS